MKRDLAKKQEKKAQYLEEQSSKNWWKPTQGEVSKAYELAGDEYSRIGDKLKARVNYGKAIQYAYNNKIEDRISEKIKKIKYNPFFVYEKNKKIKNKSSFLERISEEASNLEKTIGLWRLGYAGFSILSLISALFLLSFNLTGYTIFNIEQNNLCCIGICFFLIGLVFAFFYFKRK